MKQVLAGVIVCISLAWISVLAGAAAVSPSALEHTFQAGLLHESAVRMAMSEACGVRPANPAPPCRECPRERGGQSCVPVPCGTGSTLSGGDAHFVCRNFHGKAHRSAYTDQVTAFVAAPEPPPPRA